jgi:xanthine dehydrogenase accessory factor
VRWIDSRDDEFPEIIPAGVDKAVNEFPVDEIADMPANSYFIVMTHNHQLDQELTEAILKRNDFGYYGLIGSQTKRKKFEHRLKAKGFSDEQLARMTCPMGIPAVKGKLPAEIAVSIAGEVIAKYNARLGRQKEQTPAETPVIERLAI